MRDSVNRTMSKLALLQARAEFLEQFGHPPNKQELLDAVKARGIPPGALADAEDLVKMNWLSLATER